MRRLTADELDLIVGSIATKYGYQPEEDASELSEISVPGYSIPGYSAPPPPPPWSSAPPPPPWAGDPPTPPPCYHPAPQAGPDLGFIIGNEGGILPPYVPGHGNPIKGKPNISGVTLGAGVDLYGKTEGQLEALGFTPAQAAQLYPYTLYQGPAAQTYLTQHPVDPPIPTSELSTITDNALQQWENNVEQAYNAAESDGIPWSDLPSGVTTAILDLAYLTSNGSTYPQAAPNTWSYLTSGDWPDLYSELDNYAPNDPALEARAQKDAPLVQDDENSGALPQPGQVTCPQ